MGLLGMVGGAAWNGGWGCLEWWVGLLGMVGGAAWNTLGLLGIMQVLEPWLAWQAGLSGWGCWGGAYARISAARVGGAAPEMINMKLLVAISWLLVTARGQDDCAMLQESQLGDTTGLSGTGLLADALSLQTGDATLTYQLLEFNTVCLAQGSVRDTYRSTSLIVRFRDSGGTESTMQLHLQCVDGAWNTAADGISGSNAATAAGGTLTTALRINCFLCLDPSLASAGVVSTEEHCIGKSCGSLQFAHELFVAYRKWGGVGGGGGGGGEGGHKTSQFLNLFSTIFLKKLFDRTSVFLLDSA